MTLAKQTTLLMMMALSTIFVCTLFITVYQSKVYFEEQLLHNTEDTATALGLSLSKMPNKKMDNALVLQTISAVFDRGYFNSIAVRDVQGATVVKRYLKTKQNHVPGWFIKLVCIHNNEKTALIMSGWRQLGEVVVKSDSSIAYDALWHTAKKLFWLFLLTTILITSISVVLIKIMFNPLKQIIQQAEDIGKKNLYTLDKQPKLKELNQLSNTMNSMVTKLKIFFTLQIEEIEALRTKAYQDSLTGMGNRRYFFQQFNQYLSDENYFTPGYLFLIKLSGLAEFNSQHGYQQGDQLIFEASRQLDTLFMALRLFLLARLDGPSFAAVIFEHDRQLIESLASDISEKMNQFLKTRDERLSCSIEVVKCRFAEASSNLLAKADKLTNEERKQQGIHYNIESEEIEQLSVSNPMWQETIEAAIDNKRFHFYAQPVRSHQTFYHKECFIKLLVGSEEISANLFFPIVEQYTLGSDIDRVVLKEVMSLKENLPIAINISKSTVEDPKKQEQFLALLKKTKHPQTIIHFELSELTLITHMPLATFLINQLVEQGHVVGLDRVGATLHSLDYLKTLDLTYLKLDGSLTKEIRTNQLNQDIIKKWVKTAQRLDIILIATAIETESQWHILSELGVTCFQGNYIQSPSRLNA